MPTNQSGRTISIRCWSARDPIGLGSIPSTWRRDQWALAGSPGEVPVTVRKVCVLVTARPSYSRIKTALQAISDHPSLELQFVVAASALLDRFGRAADVMEADGFSPVASIQMVLEGDSPTTMAKTTGIGLMELSTVLDNLRPDVVVTVADRYETLATAVAASYMNIPLAHVQGGEVSGSIDEKVRHAVTKLADTHLVASDRAAERVVRMGEQPERVHVTGCPSIDLAADVAADPALDFDPFDRYGGVGDRFPTGEDYLVVMQHPVTTDHDNAHAHAWETLCAVRDTNMPTFWFWPNVDAGTDHTSNAIRTFRELERPDNLHFFKNMEPHDFLRLLVNSRCLVGNSSVGIRECAFLGVPVVNLGGRQAGRERGPNVRDSQHDRDAVGESIVAQLDHGPFVSDPVYGDGNAGPRIAAQVAEMPLTVEKRLAY